MVISPPPHLFIVDVFPFFPPSQLYIEKLATGAADVVGIWSWLSEVAKSRIIITLKLQLTRLLHNR